MARDRERVPSFHTGYNIETVRLFGGKVFDADAAVIDIVHTFGSGMGLGGLQRFFRHIDTDNVRRAALCHAFRQNPAAAADIQNTLARQLRERVYIAQAQRIDVVQRFELAVFIPPLSAIWLNLAISSASTLCCPAASIMIFLIWISG